MRKRLNSCSHIFHAYTSLIYEVHAWKNGSLKFNRLRYLNFDKKTDDFIKFDSKSLEYKIQFLL